MLPSIAAMKAPHKPQCRGADLEDGWFKCRRIIQVLMVGVGIACLLGLVCVKNQGLGKSSHV